MSFITFTSHAVERYIEKHDQSLSFNDAHEILNDHAHEAVRLRETMNSGDHIYVIDSLGIRLTLKNENGRRVCTTIMPPTRWSGKRGRRRGY